MPASGIDTVGIPVPPRPVLIGQNFDVQPADVAASPFAISLADNDVTITVTGGVGTSVFATGSGTTLLDVVRVQNADMGNGTKLNTGAPYDTESIRVIGPRGWSQGYDPTFTSTDYNADPGILRGDRVARDMRDGTFPSISLPNGRNLAVVEDTANAGTYLAITIDQVTGALTELSGTRTTIATGTVDPFGDYWGFSPDGSIAIAIVDHNSTTNAMPDDKVLLIRTDNSNWTASAPRRWTSHRR